MRGGIRLRFRRFAICIIFLLDLFLLPRLLQFPATAQAAGGVKAGTVAWKRDLRARPLAGPVILARDARVRVAWGWSQGLVLAAALAVLMPFPGRRRLQGRTGDLGGPPAAGSGQHGTARWRTEREISETLTTWRPPEELRAGGFVLGARPGRRFTAWLDSQDGHLFLLGATRSGKSRRVVLPTIWTLAQAGESMIVTDPKGELYAYAAAWLRGRGYRVVLLDFRDPVRGNRWNPLQAVAQARQAGDVPAAGQAAWDLGHVLAFSGGTSSEPFWQNQAEALITALALAVAGHAPDEARHMLSAYRLLIDRPPEALDAFFLALKTQDDPAWPAYGTVALTTGNTRASVTSTATAQMRLWADPAVAWLTGAQDHELDAPGRETAAVFLVIPDERKTRYPLATLYVAQVHQALTALAGRSPGGKLPVRVNFLLDEFGNLPAIPDFDTKLTVAGGRGMRFLLAVQDLAQLKKHYRESTPTITGNCATWLYLSTADLETAKVVVGKAGRYTVLTESTSASVRANDYSRGSSDSLAARDLLTPDEVLRWPLGQALILQTRQHPAHLPLPDLSEWPAARDLAPGAEDDAKGAMNAPKIWQIKDSRTQKPPTKAVGGPEYADL